ncbi:unspecified product [Leishmania tarentolae]|uniref:Unspecified product n=1 Tax=Leishmania tarentolae TaxID=5689 RepID=A0A640KI86_LEITA|nr:unspecified product [Leishmania tarentolae]
MVHPSKPTQSTRRWGGKGETTKLAVASTCAAIVTSCRHQPLCRGRKRKRGDRMQCTCNHAWAAGCRTRIAHNPRHSVLAVGSVVLRLITIAIPIARTLLPRVAFIVALRIHMGAVLLLLPSGRIDVISTLIGHLCGVLCAEASHGLYAGEINKCVDGKGAAKG